MTLIYSPGDVLTLIVSAGGLLTVISSPGEPGPGWPSEWSHPDVVLLEVVLTQLTEGLAQGQLVPTSWYHQVYLEIFFKIIILISVYLYCTSIGLHVVLCTHVSLR